MNYQKDLTGLKFGRLTVEKRAHTPEKDRIAKTTHWVCICECGNKKVIRRNTLINGDSHSCGCLRKEKSSKRAKENTTHGLSKTRFYKIWIGMKQRCEDKDNNQYHNYGGRGILVCREWHTFENFVYDMYDSYIEFEDENGKNTASIDRIDSNGGYNRENCKWATQLEQARNRGSNIDIIVDNIYYNTLTELAEAYDLDYQLVYYRYKRGKRGLELVSNKERTNKGKNTRGIAVEVNNKIYNSLTELQKEYPHISVVSISKRYKRGLRNGDLIK